MFAGHYNNRTGVLKVKGVVKKALAMLMAAAVMMCCFCSVSVNAEKSGDDENTAAEGSASETEELEEMLEDEDGSMDMDVIFVLDASGSMLYSDPNKVAIDAFNLFVDLLDDSCGVGYVVYTQKIEASSDIVSLNDSKGLDKVKKEITNLEYDPVGDTDIALGLTKAMDIYKKNKNTDPNRNQVIVLLSDGNTDLPNGPRTVDESKKEMTSTLSELKEMGVPVYSIGLNYNGALDEKEVANISGSTNGKAYKTKQSSGLIKIATDIFGDIYNLEGTQKDIVDGNVQIEVKDNTVFYVNVVIRSGFTKSELNPVLTSPDGKNVPLDGSSDKVNVTSTNSYTLLKLIYPDSGTWNLHLDNVTEDNCVVTQMDFYSIYVKQTFSSKSAGPGQTIEITATLNDNTGVLQDSDLISTINMSTIITSDEGEQTIPLTRLTNGQFTGKIILNTEGTYSVKTRASGNKFQKSSRTETIRIGEIYAIDETASGSDKDNSGKIDTSHTDTELSTDKDQGDKALLFIIIGVAIVLLIIIVFLIMRANQKAPVEAPEEPKEDTRPKGDPVREKPQQMPKATDPDLVKYKLVEHDALENLIKKGPEDAFNTSADDYKVDENLEKIIRKGAEDPFNTNAADYADDPNLANIIKSGEEDPFNTNADDYADDPNLANYIKSGEEDPFNTNADDYADDPNLANIIKSGEEDPFNTSADDYQSDPALAGIVRAGEEGFAPGGNQNFGQGFEDGSDDYDQYN